MNRRVLTVVLVSILLLSTMLGGSAWSALAEGELYHTVKWGETLSSIARMYGVTVQALASDAHSGVVARCDSRFAAGHRAASSVGYVTRPHRFAETCEVWQ